MSMFENAVFEVYGERFDGYSEDGIEVELSIPKGADADELVHLLNDALGAGTYLTWEAFGLTDDGRELWSCSEI